MIRSCEACGLPRESGIMRICDLCFAKQQRRDEREREKVSARGLPPHVAREIRKIA